MDMKTVLEKTRHMKEVAEPKKKHGTDKTDFKIQKDS